MPVLTRSFSLQSLDPSCYRRSGTQAVDWIGQWLRTDGGLCDAYSGSHFFVVSFLGVHTARDHPWLPGLRDHLHYLCNRYRIQYHSEQSEPQSGSICVSYTRDTLFNDHI